jgi:hypothetical protein
MQTLFNAAAVVLLVGLVLAGGVMIYRLWRAGMRERGTLLLHRMFEHEGVSQGACTNEVAAGQAANAARRCLLCRDRETCVEWLEGQSTEELEQFCLNADLIGRLKAQRGASSPSAG